MERKILVVGDPPAAGGRVLPYDGPMLDLYGHRVALTHFTDCFDSFDTIYHLAQSLEGVKTNPAGMKTNADSLAGYVIFGEIFGRL